MITRPTSAKKALNLSSDYQIRSRVRVNMHKEGRVVLTDLYHFVTPVAGKRSVYAAQDVDGTREISDKMFINWVHDSAGGTLAIKV